MERANEVQLSVADNLPIEGGLIFANAAAMKKIETRQRRARHGSPVVCKPAQS
jgi:hypothetical protein